MDSFLSSLTPEPFRVLGVSLKRLTFGHVVLLNRMGVDPIEGFVDLVLAVQICSRNYQGALRYIDSLPKRWRYFANWWFIKRSKRCDFEAAFEAWNDYLEENQHRPKWSEAVSENESKRGAPPLAQVRAFLLSKCNYSPDTIMEQPYGQCLWDAGSVSEQFAGEGIVGAKHRDIAELLTNANS